MVQVRGETRPSPGQELHRKERTFVLHIDTFR
jgi:hypothetical protein